MTSLKMHASRYVNICTKLLAKFKSTYFKNLQYGKLSYAQCRAYTTLDHTDAKASVVCWSCLALALMWFSLVRHF